MRQLIILCTIVGLIAGCQTPTHERVFLRYPERQAPLATNVPFNGQYRLYPNPPRFPTAQNSTPLMEARLNKGDRVGFVLGESGKLLAVIGAEQKLIVNTAATSFTWTMQPDAGQFDSERTIGLIVVVLFVTGVSLGVIAWTNRPFK
jgi:hypothetical protein